MAIGRFRGETISAFTDETVASEACLNYYQPSRDFVLADFWWNFAGKSVDLGQQAAEPDEWAFGYTYPPDALKVRYLYTESKLRHLQDPIPFEVALAADSTKSIFTNLDAAKCRYTIRLENVNQFDPHFVTALSWYLASEIAIPIAGTAKGRILADRAAQGYQNAIIAAYSANANEEEIGPARDPESIRAHQ